MTTQESGASDLAAVFDGLIELVQESKQVLWSVSSRRMHAAVDSLKHFLEEQGRRIDEAELEAGGRPASFVTPAAHQPRNIIAIARGDPAVVVEVLVEDATALLEAVRQAEASTAAQWRPLLSELAAGLDEHISELRQNPRLRGTVVVTFAPEPRMRQAIEEQLADVANVAYLEEVKPGDRLSVLKAADAVLGWGLGHELVDRAEFDALRSVKLVQVLSAGVEGLPFHVIPAEVPIASNAGSWAAPMAEHVLALTLALAKHLPQRHADMRRGQFNKAPNREIRGSVVGIVGYGGIGRSTARLFRAFGARIHAINRSGKADEGVEWLGTLDALDSLLSQADVVVLSLPFSRATERLIGRRELGLMKPDAIFINVARAGVVDEDALFDHLQRHPDFSAGLDVWWQESRTGSIMRRSFLDLPNVIGSPHNSANTQGSPVEAARLAAANVARALRQEPIANLVDRREYAR